MSAASAAASDIADLSAAWREWATRSERQWNEFFNQLMGTEEFSQSLGRNLDVFLHFQKTMNEAMGSWFMTMNVPTRTDILALGDRLLAIENRLAALEARLSDMEGAASPDGDAARPRPRRTKRPDAPPDGAANSHAN